MGNDLNKPTIGLFGGTFDPPHLGHLNLAVEMLEKHGLDEVWFCPARVNPFKQKEPPTSTEHRVAMLKLALGPYPRFRILEDEINRVGPSYTFDTLHTLIQKEKSQSKPAQFALILGEDAIGGFSKWHRAEEIVRLVPLLIGSRSNIHGEVAGSKEILEAIDQGLTNTRIMEISATEVRARLKKGLFCGHLVPREVLDYIKTYHLYL